MNSSNQTIATTLDKAAFLAAATEQVSKTQAISLADAYEIQAASIQRRYERGEKLVGIKLGFTSKAKMEQMGVHDMIWGRLTDMMHYKDGDNLPLGRFIHARAEPEIAFLINQDVKQEVTLENALDIIGGVTGAIEIIDSRYQNFKFSLEDVIADNCSSSGFVVGKWQNPKTDISQLKMSLIVNGKAVHEGSSSAILGNPIQSIVDAVRLTLAYGEPLKKGMILLAGAATPAVYINAGEHIEVEVEQLGKVGLHVV